MTVGTMQQLERTVVQLHEAQRLARCRDVPHGRIALLLLDNAAETMLMRLADTAFTYSDMYGGMLRTLKRLDPQDDEGQQLLRLAEGRALSKSARRRVQREFGALVDYVFGQDESTLDPAFAGCLNSRSQDPPPLPQRGAWSSSVGASPIVC